MAAPLSPALRHGYGLGGLGYALVNTCMLFFLLKYLVDGAGIGAATVGWVLLAGKVWDGLIDPAIGKLIDRTRTSWGSRRPWMAGALLPMAALFATVFWGVPLDGWGEAVFYALVLMAYNTAYSLVVVPYGAITPALTDDYDERTRLNGARMGWSMVGGIVAGVVFPLIWKTYGWRVAGLALAAASIPPLVIAIGSTRGRDPVGPVDAAEDGPSMWSVLRVVAFRRTAILFLTAWSSIAVLSSLIPFYVEHHMHHKEMTDLFFAAIQLSALVSVPLVVWAAARLEKHRAYALFVLIWGAVLVALSAVPEAAPVGPAGLDLRAEVLGLQPRGVALLMCVLAGPGVAAAHVLPWSMLPDVVEIDTAENGTSRAGAFYGVMTFLEQVGTAAALWGVGQALGLAGYVPEATTQPDAARMALQGMIGPLPAIVLLGAGVFAWWFPPITRDAHHQVAKATHA